MILTYFYYSSIFNAGLLLPVFFSLWYYTFTCVDDLNMDWHVEPLCILHHTCSTVCSAVHTVRDLLSIIFTSAKKKTWPPWSCFYHRFLFVCELPKEQAIHFWKSSVSKCRSRKFLKDFSMLWNRTPCLGGDVFMLFLYDFSLSKEKKNRHMLSSMV